MLTISIIKNSNIFHSQCQVLVNTVNCVGLMDEGLALEMKNRYPLMFEKYKELCDKKLLKIGSLWIFKPFESKQWILNFPTKEHWQTPSKYEYIEEGIKKFTETYKEKGITSIAFPMLDYSDDNLNKEKIIEILIKYLVKCDNLIVEIYY